jgi:hypothetical protein
VIKKSNFSETAKLAVEAKAYINSAADLDGMSVVTVGLLFNQAQV